MSNIGFATLQVIPSLKGAGDALTKGILPASTNAGDKAGKNIGSKMRGGILGSMKGIAGPLVAAFAGAKVIDFFKDSVAAASDLSESTSKVGVVFKGSAKQIVDASKTSASAVGLSQEAYLAANGTLGNLLVSLKVAPKAAAGMSQQMVALAGDLASFNNVSPEDALAAITSGLTGETEPLKRFGVNMNDATLRAQALKMGLIKTTKDALNPQSKALAAQALIMDQTKTAQGDFARTSGGLANQQRILAANMTNVKATIGKALLPAMTKAVSLFSGFLNGLTQGTGAGGKFASVAKGIGTAVSVGFGVFKARVLPVIIQFGKYLINNAVPAAQNLYKAIAPLVKSAVELAISIGSKVIPVIANLAKTLGGGVVTALGAVAKFVGDNATLFQSLAVGIGAALVVWKAWQVALGIGTAVMKGISIVTKGFAAAQAALNVVLSLNPIGLVVIALVALAAGLIYAYKHSETFRNIVNGVFTAVRDFVVGAATAVRDAVVTAWNAIKSATSTAWNAVKTAISAAWNFIKGLVTTQVNIIKAVVTGAWNGIKAATSAVWNAIKTAVSVVVGSLIAIVRADVNLIKGAITGAWNGIKTATSAAWNGIKTAVSTAISGVVTLVSGIRGKVTGALGNLGSLLLNAGRDIIQGLISGIDRALGGLKDKLKSVTNIIPDWKGPIDTDRKLLTPAGEAIIGSLITGMDAQLPALRAFLTGVSTSIAGGLTASPSIDLAARGLAGSARLDARSTTASSTNGSGNQRPINITVPADDPEAAARKVGRFLANQGV